jgi:hypothetical protein
MVPESTGISSRDSSVVRDVPDRPGFLVLQMREVSDPSAALAFGGQSARAGWLGTSLEKGPIVADRAVRKTGKDRDGDITSLCDDGASWSPRGKWDAINDIETRAHAYYVPWNSGRTEIRVVNGANGKYLRTDSDGTTKNNLDDLPDC